MKPKELENKVAVITGAGGDIGRAMSLLFAREGACVVAADMNGEKAKETVEAVCSEGGQAMAFTADVRDSNAIRRMVDETLQKYGSLDILVNNAGASAMRMATNKLSLFIDSEESTWDWVIGVNLVGQMICAKAVLPQMVKQEKGKIINMSSVAGVQGLPQRVDYSAAKGGIISLTKALAIELGHYHINVNCISPGSIGREGSPPTLLGRRGDAAEVGELALFLASDRADFITGQNYIIDGGRCLSTRW